MCPPLEHLPVALWPPQDHCLFDAAYAPGDVFDDTGGAGQHLSPATRTSIRFAWRRWLAFLDQYHREDLAMNPADRITPERVGAYVEHLRRQVAASSVACSVAHLHAGARLVAPDRDWAWLKALQTRLQAQAQPKDRFDRLTPAHKTLDLGLCLMDQAVEMTQSGKSRREIQYRDGLILAVLSLWPIRRRSIAALTVGRHLKLDRDRAELVLFAADTKSKRAESWPVPGLLVPYLARYLADIRPALVRGPDQGAFWPSLKGGALAGGQIYELVRRRTAQNFGSAMALHDFRRAAATFLAMEAPDKIGLMPGILQHASADTGDRHYKLARSMAASRRHVGTVSEVRARLRSEIR
jgi:hypothetical protein